MSRRSDSSGSDSSNSSGGSDILEFHPDAIKAVLEWAWGRPFPKDEAERKKLITEANNEFLPDVSMFEDMTLVSCELPKYNYHVEFLVTNDELDKIEKARHIEIRVDGRHKVLSFRDFETEFYEDPYEIERFYNDDSPPEWPKWVEKIIGRQPDRNTREIDRRLRDSKNKTKHPVELRAEEARVALQELHAKHEAETKTTESKDAI